MRRRTRIVAGAVVLIIAAHPVYAQLFFDSAYPESTVRLSAEPTIPQGESGVVTITIDVPDGWHTYWRNPGDGGSALRAEWKLPTGVFAADPRWPLPRLYEQGGITSYGHEGAVLVHVPITIAADAPLGTARIAAEIEWFVCEVVCLQYTASVDTSFAITGEAKGTATGPERVAPPVLPAVARASGDALSLSVATTAVVVAADEEIWFFPYEWGLIDQSEHQEWRAFADGHAAELSRGAGTHAVAQGLLVVFRDGEPIEGFEIDTPIIEEG